MALPWALAVLSLLPLLDARSPVCANFTVAPLTNSTLDRLSGKWFYIAGASRNPEFKEAAKTFQAAFFYFALNHTEDTIELRQYLTVGNHCVYESSILNVHRENKTISKREKDKERVASMILTADPKIYMLAQDLDDEQNVALSLYADKPEVTQEQLKVLHVAIECKGLDKSEIIYADVKKDQCGPLEKQHEEERKKTNEEPQEDAEQG
ncbi:alpha-1-acid glycoprotein-like [Diceros bicornis minor]|uniref:alpha-1-acid glycoprotein-like n=1 Tax=Diceros bicornis minor TaxID=77932 RepID=UPI0026EA7429|nr:alpha-1-acid glycoprotein-like [Diceros bicornis minor]